MTTTRRLSGMQQGQGHQATSLMLETYETFKRKHLSQNREIINKNSELHKTNADLQRQISLMRAERLSLKGSQFQLECENAALRDRLDRADERERQLIDERDRLRLNGGSAALDPDQVEAMRHALANAFKALQTMGLMLPTVGTPLPSPEPVHAPAAAPESPLASTSAAEEDASSHPNNNISLSRRRSLAARAARASMVMPPDLSNISEGGSSAEDDGEGSTMGSWGARILPRMPAYSASTIPDLPASHVPPVASTSGPTPSASPPPVSSLPTLPGPASVPAPPLTRPARAPRAPPKAPSAAAHDSLASLDPGLARSGASSNTLPRPKRRVSGMLRPGLASAGRSEFGMAEEDQAEEDRQEEDEDAVGGQGAVMGQGAMRDDDADAGGPLSRTSSTPVTVAATATNAANPTKVKRRVSSATHSLSLAPAEALAAAVPPGRTTRSGRTPTPEPEPGPPPPQVISGSDEGSTEQEQPEVSDRRRPYRKALREIQPVEDTPPIVPSHAGKIRPKADAPPRSPMDPDEGAGSTSRGSALLQAKKEALRSQRAAPTPVRATPAASMGDLRGDGAAEESEGEVEADEGEDTSGASSWAAEETVLGPKSRTRAAPTKAVAELEPLHEEGSNSQDTTEEGGGGRRARKSVNYALPKLNTKMRRPEDYVPVIKHVAGASSSHNKPRKSTKPGLTGGLAPPPIDAPAARPASLAGKKPRVSPAAATDRILSASDDSDHEDDATDAWNERQFLQRVAASGASARKSTASASTLAADVDERRARPTALAKRASGAAVSRRHSVAV